MSKNEPQKNNQTKPAQHNINGHYKLIVQKTHKKFCKCQ